MSLDWRVYCLDTIDKVAIPGCFGGGKTETYLDWLFAAWGQTVIVAALSLVVALVVGSLVGILRTLPASPVLARLATMWVEFFRNIPLLVQIFLWYHVLPGLFPVLRGLPSFLLVVFALGFFTSARIAEQVKAGIQSLSLIHI